MKESSRNSNGPLMLRKILDQFQQVLISRFTQVIPPAVLWLADSQAGFWWIRWPMWLVPLLQASTGVLQQRQTGQVWTRTSRFHLLVPLGFGPDSVYLRGPGPSVWWVIAQFTRRLLFITHISSAPQIPAGSDAPERSAAGWWRTSSSSAPQCVFCLFESVMQQIAT